MNEVRKLKNKQYPLVIEVNAPIRFFWTEKGFDGIDVCLNHKLFTSYQSDLLHLVFDEIGKAVVNNPGIDVPAVFKKAFNE